MPRGRIEVHSERLTDGEAYALRRQVVQNEAKAAQLKHLVADYQRLWREARDEFEGVKKTFTEMHDGRPCSCAPNAHQPYYTAYHREYAARERLESAIKQRKIIRFLCSFVAFL